VLSVLPWRPCTIPAWALLTRLSVAVAVNIVTTTVSLQMVARPLLDLRWAAWG
jgi:hypothetical protein